MSLKRAKKLQMLKIVNFVLTQSVKRKLNFCVTWNYVKQSDNGKPILIYYIYIYLYILYTLKLFSYLR